MTNEELLHEIAQAAIRDRLRTWGTHAGSPSTKRGTIIDRVLPATPAEQRWDRLVNREDR